MANTAQARKRARQAVKQNEQGRADYADQYREQ